MSASLCPTFQSDFNPARNAIEVQTTSLDDYLGRYFPGSSLLLKIDAEGHEAEVLRGAKSRLENQAPDVVLEVLSHQPAEAGDLLRELGYKFYQITDCGLTPAHELVLVQNGDLAFLNYLASKRGEPELAGISNKIVNLASKIDLKKTSKYFGPRKTLLSSPIALWSAAAMNHLMVAPELRL